MADACVVVVWFVLVGDSHAVELNAKPNVESRALAMISQANIDNKVTCARWATKATQVVCQVPTSDLMRHHDRLCACSLVCDRKPDVDRREDQQAHRSYGPHRDSDFLQRCQRGEQHSTNHCADWEAARLAPSLGERGPQRQDAGALLHVINPVEIKRHLVQPLDKRLDLARAERPI